MIDGTIWGRWAKRAQITLCVLDGVHTYSVHPTFLKFSPIFTYTFSNMFSSWILIIGLFFQYHISFSSADGFFTDDLLAFNTEDPDPLQGAASIDLLDSTNSNPSLILDADFTGDNENPDIFNIPLNNVLGPSDLFVSDADLNSVIDPTSFDIADCSSMNNGVLRQKARVRRQTTCGSPYYNSEPNLSLPTLDQAKKDPLQPKNEREKPPADIIFTLRMGNILTTTSWILASCRSKELGVCSSGSSADIQLESNGATYELRGVMMSKYLFLSTTRIILMLHHSQLFFFFLHPSTTDFLLPRFRARCGDWLLVERYIISDPRAEPMKISE